MVFAGLGVALSSFASPTGAGSDLGGWVPVWSDEFDYSGPPDPSKWTVLDAPNTPAANAFVDGSALILRVDKNGKGVNMGTGNTSSIDTRAITARNTCSLPADSISEPAPSSSPAS